MIRLLKKNLPEVAGFKNEGSGYKKSGGGLLRLKRTSKLIF